MSRIIRIVVGVVAMGSIGALGVVAPATAPGSSHDSVQADPHWCC